MKLAYLSFVLNTALALLPSASALAQPPPLYLHPDPALTGQTFFPLFQSHRLMPRGNAIFLGERRLRKNFGAVEGLLRLGTKPSGPGVTLDVDAFATCRGGERSPAVVSTTLVKTIPGSVLYSFTYPAQVFQQLGANIRTHWALVYTQPGTTFRLDVQVRCTSVATGLPQDHIDRYVWQVVATFESIRALIDAVHTHAIGTAEIPALTSEAVFVMLDTSIDQIEDKVRQGDVPGAKALIASLQSQLQSYAAGTLSGFLSTAENPAPQALGVALEYLKNHL